MSWLTAINLTSNGLLPSTSSGLTTTIGFKTTPGFLCSTQITVSIELMVGKKTGSGKTCVALAGMVTAADKVRLLVRADHLRLDLRNGIVLVQVSQAHGLGFHDRAPAAPEQIHDLVCHPLKGVDKPLWRYVSDSH